MKQRIIVTGGAGFIGSHFLNTFVLEFSDIDFINIDNLTYAGKLEHILEQVQEAPNYFFEKGDIRSRDEIVNIYKKHTPTDIIHFAAETHVDTSIANPSIFLETNTLGTHNLLSLHREFGLNRFHHISTDEVYGDIDGEGYFTEDSPLDPSSPYSASKASADLMVKAYGKTYGIDYVITRSSNNYGPNQADEKFIPHSLSLLLQNKPITLYGDGSNTRDWIHVGDHVEALWQVFTRGMSTSIYNIGGNNEHTNFDIARMILAHMGKGDEYISFVPDRPGHDKRYALGTTKIQTELAWIPKIDFKKGLIRTIESYL